MILLNPAQIIRILWSKIAQNSEIGGSTFQKHGISTNIIDSIDYNCMWWQIIIYVNTRKLIENKHVENRKVRLHYNVFS